MTLKMKGSFLRNTYNKEESGKYLQAQCGIMGKLFLTPNCEHIIKSQHKFLHNYVFTKAKKNTQQLWKFSLNIVNKCTHIKHFRLIWNLNREKRNYNYICDIARLNWNRKRESSMFMSKRVTIQINADCINIREEILVCFLDRLHLIVSPKLNQRA